ncbi:hypothetical protein [Oceanobacillus senegalensis]|uniref:hypothetical protein n=1 Tax=Oceanobacillus senegalensis TaxID=1936063 RepID=UPI000A3130E9|nr:hypothetical protein [Oceanobacillus senegalensis]
MSQMLALVILITILFIGEAISIRTRAWIPSVFIYAILFIIGYWTFFPKDIVEMAGVPSVVVTMMIYLLITNMGTLLSLKELKNQWKTILIALAGISGAAMLLLTIGTVIFGREAMIVGVPPLVGGVVSSLIMSEGAQAAGLTSLSVFAIVIYVVQGFVGYPLTSIMLKREGRNYLQKYRNGSVKVEAPSGVEATVEEPKLKLFKKLPEKYNTNFFKFFRLAIVSYLAYLTSVLVEPIVTIHPYVLCLLFGVIATSIGFLEPHVLEKANGFGFAMLVLLLFIFDGLKNATPTMLLDILGLLIGTIVIGMVGMYIFSWVMGKVLKVSKEMAFAVSLTALYGFPADYVITNEVVQSMTTDEKEKEALLSHMLPPMLVGGFITVTIVSVVLAGVFVTWL